MPIRLTLILSDVSKKSLATASMVAAVAVGDVKGVKDEEVKEERRRMARWRQVIAMAAGVDADKRDLKDR